jgi:hypothetical protein
MMRPLKKLLPLALATVFVAGCAALDQPEPELGTPGNPVLGSGQMTSAIDGTPWSTTNIVVAQFTSYLRLTATVDGGTPTARTVVIQVVKSGGTANAPVGVPGAQLLGSTGPNAYAQVAFGSNEQTLWTTIQGAQSGEVIITTFTPTRIAGTFSFTARAASAATTPQNRVVTSGSFDVTY